MRRTRGIGRPRGRCSSTRLRLASRLTANLQAELAQVAQLAVIELGKRAAVLVLAKSPPPDPRCEPLAPSGTGTRRRRACRRSPRLRLDHLARAARRKTDTGERAIIELREGRSVTAALDGSGELPERARQGGDAGRDPSRPRLGGTGRNPRVHEHFCAF